MLSGLYEVIERSTTVLFPFMESEESAKFKCFRSTMLRELPNPAYSFLCQALRKPQTRGIPPVVDLSAFIGETPAEETPAAETPVEPEATEAPSEAPTEEVTCTAVQEGRVRLEEYVVVQYNSTVSANIIDFDDKEDKLALDVFYRVAYKFAEESYDQKGAINEIVLGPR